MFSQHPPFHTLHEAGAAVKIYSGFRPSRPGNSMCTDALWELIELCWSQSPAARPTMSDVLRLLCQADRPHVGASTQESTEGLTNWVMWAGNVPADTTHDELWRVFTAPASGEAGAKPGVRSLHLIAHSNCALVNFGSEAQLQAAIARFDGTPVRVGDPRCPRLVCRQHRIEDDLRAGIVSWERGTGVQQRWVRHSATPEAGEARSPGSTPGAIFSTRVRTVSFQDDELSARERDSYQQTERHGSSTSDSYASADSSLLSQHFPKRYFILKSFSQVRQYVLTEGECADCVLQHDLDISTQTGLWETHPHNNLDQAFRRSKEVYLFFIVINSNEFFGYARLVYRRFVSLALTPCNQDGWWTG
jgi:hypothetical protein